MKGYRYRIRWQSKITSVQGHGRFVLDKETAKEISRNCNRRIPELRHWIESSKWR